MVAANAALKIPPSGPSPRPITVTPHDTNELAYAVRAFYVGVTGNVSVVNDLGDTVVWVAVPAGQIIPCQTRRVLATGTTATSIVGLV